MSIKKDIENLKTIVRSIEAVERNSEPGSVLAAERLDCLYTALKVQANTVIETSMLEEANETIIH